VSGRSSGPALNIGVVGGSIGRLFAATLLLRAGHRVTVFERSVAGLSRRGAGLVAQRELFALLQAVDRASASRVGVVATERITLDRRGEVISRDPSPQTQLSWDHLYDVLRALVPEAGYRLGENVVTVRDGVSEAVIELQDGRSESFDLVVGADGLGSVTRATIAPGDDENRYVGYVTWRGLIPEGSVSGRAARTLLGRFAFYNGPGEHMLGYLVPGAGGETTAGDRRYNWVWYRRLSRRQLDDLMQDVGRPTGSFSTAPGELPAARRSRLVDDAIAVLPTQFASAVAAEPAPFLQAIYDYVPPRMVGNRVALLGDAACVVRPHTAMGAAKAAGDALTLHAALADVPVAEALRRYERERLPVARAIAQYGQRLGASLPL